jgi:hypothetical protein
MTEYDITRFLPQDGAKVQCYGHATYCCEEDMEADPAWHDVIFNIVISSYTLKKELPKTSEDSIIENAKLQVVWNLIDEKDEFYTHVIKVTKWRYPCLNMIVSTYR